MKTTVIVCTYNRCESLAESLESIAASKLPEEVEWEVLVVDNNSTDHTRSVVEALFSHYPGRFRYLFEPQQGLSYARNAGVRKSGESVLAFTDDDVIVEPDWLWNLTSALHDGKCGGAGGRIIPVWAKPLPSWLSTADPQTMGAFVSFDQGSEAGRLNRPPYGANMAFRKEMFEKFGFFRTDLGRSANNLQGREDIEFANRLLAAGERLRYEPSAVVHHPVPESRMTKRFVLRWSFWYGNSEIVEMGPPSDARWLIHGVPLYLLRRLVRWTLQWMISIPASRRFSCKRNLCYILGIIVACYRWPQGRNVQASSADQESGGSLERTPSQASTIK